MRAYFDDNFWKMFFGFISIVSLSILFVLIVKTADLKISENKASVVNLNSLEKP